MSFSYGHCLAITRQQKPCSKPLAGSIIFCIQHQKQYNKCISTTSFCDLPMDVLYTIICNVKDYRDTLRFFQCNKTIYITMMIPLTIRHSQYQLSLCRVK